MEKKKMGLAARVLIALAIGIIVGIIVHSLPPGALRTL